MAAPRAHANSKESRLSSKTRPRCSSPTSALWPNGPGSTTWPWPYYADTEFGLATSQDRIAALKPLVRAYASGLDNPLTGAEREILPWAIARQPLWGIGGWVALLDNQDTAQAHARATFPAVRRALQLVTDIHVWHAGLSS